MSLFETIGVVFLFLLFLCALAYDGIELFRWLFPLKYLTVEKFRFKKLLLAEKRRKEPRERLLKKYSDRLQEIESELEIYKNL